jgi:demethylmenaquinone methyltransferase / 2-methoxy-6-polyprenyl-1,4-benzoquinol methylase
MRDEPHSERARYVQGMFGRIAPHYDLLNRLMTAGQDRAWRRQVIQLAGLPDGGRLLDLGAGTGDLSGEALRQHPSSRPLAADFTPGMLRVGQPRYGDRLDWCAADALRLPFPSASFDAVVSGFLLRNVVDLPRALAEQQRVLKPGGRLVALDTTRPPRSLLTPLIRFHMHTIIPFLGRIISGQADAYRYLPETSEGFLASEELQACIAAAGFRQVGFRRLMFGTIAIHWARK